MSHKQGISRTSLLQPVSRTLSRTHTLWAVVAVLGMALGTAVAQQQAPQTDYYTVLLATNPIAYFHFDSENGGSVVGGYTTTFVGNATVGIPAAPLHEKKNKSIVLPGGGGDYVTTSLFGGIPGTGSMVAWVRLAELPSQAGRFFYVCGESQNANDLDLQFENDNKLYFYVGGLSVYTPNVKTLVKKWHMIAVTYVGGGNGSRSIYWDGKLVVNDTGNIDGTPKTTQFSVGYSLVFGGRDFQGNIDDVAVWGRALSTAEVAGIYASK